MQWCRINGRGHPRLTWLMTIEQFNIPCVVCCYGLDPFSCENFCAQLHAGCWRDDDDEDEVDNDVCRCGLYVWL